MLEPAPAPPPPAQSGRAALNPMTLVFASFVLAPLGAGIALAVNDSRLGLKERAPLTFYLFFFVALVCYLVVARLHVDGVFSFGSRAGWLLGRVLLGWLALVLAFVWSRGAVARFAELRRAHAPLGNPLPVCLPALLASVCLDLLVWQVFLRR